MVLGGGVEVAALALPIVIIGQRKRLRIVRGLRIKVTPAALLSSREGGRGGGGCLLAERILI